MHVFLSFHSKERALAEAIRAGLSRLEPGIDVFFSPTSLGAGFWVPKLAEQIAAADAFLLLIGPTGLGPWQEVEYFTAFDRHVKDRNFALVPVIVGSAEAPGLSFLRTLNWVEVPIVDEDKALHRLLAALKGENITTATPLWELVNPYRGLEAMTEASADYFFGRVSETAAVLTALAEKPGRCPILIGASGVGKSSVAQAGVLASIKSMRWPGTNGSEAGPWPKGLQGSRNWLWLSVRPGEAPLEALTAAVTRVWQLDARDPEHAALPRKWAKGLAVGDNTLADLISATQEELKKREGASPDRILLYVDQGEELYTHASQSEARRFSEVLATGLGDRRLAAFASLRADYFDRLQADEALFKCHEHVNVPPLDRGRLHEVVTGPARALEVGFEDGEIADRITNAAVSEPGALPLLSYLLTDMWTAMVGRGDATLRLPAQAIDVGGVLAKRAEEFLNDNPETQTALRRLLTLRLAIVPAEGEPVRRQTTHEECSEAEWTLARRLADYPWRLVVVRERDTDGQIVAEVAHEALLRAWPRLRSWLRDERDFLIFKGEAERAERRWREMEQADKALLKGLDLTRAEELLPNRENDWSAAVLAYLQRSIAADRAEKQRLLLEKEQQLRFQRAVSIGAALGALLMVVVVIFAWVKWGEANQAKLVAEGERDRAATTQSQFLADLARQQRLASDAGTALLLAIEALPDPAAAVRRPYVREAQVQLDNAMKELREQLVLTGHELDVRAVRIERDLIATASEDKTVRFWNARTGKQIGEPLKGHEAAVNALAFSPDGKRVVTASADGTARLWDVATRKQIGEPLRGHEGAVRTAVFDEQGDRIVTASADGTARLWDAKTGQQIGEPLRGHEGALKSAEFSPDGEQVLTASWDTTARLWDSATGKLIREFKGHEDTVAYAAFDRERNRDSKRIVTASWDKTVRVWEVGTGKLVMTFRGHDDSVEFAEFMDDRMVMSTSTDKTIRIWDTQTGEQVAILRGHEGAVWSATARSTDDQIVSASLDKTVRLWRLAGDAPIEDSPDDAQETAPKFSVAEARQAVPRCLSTAQRISFFLQPAPPDWCVELGKPPYNTPAWRQWLMDKQAGKETKPPLETKRD